MDQDPLGSGEHPLADEAGTDAAPADGATRLAAAAAARLGALLEAEHPPARGDAGDDGAPVSQSSGRGGAGDLDSVSSEVLMLLLALAGRWQQGPPAARGTPQAAIDALPRVQAGPAGTNAAPAADGSHAGAAAGPADAPKPEAASCPCCLEEQIDTLVLFPCGHSACEPCTLQWLSAHNTCVMCRAPVSAEAAGAAADGSGGGGGGAALTAGPRVSPLEGLSADDLEALLRRIMRLHAQLPDDAHASSEAGAAGGGSEAAVIGGGGDGEGPALEHAGNRLAGLEGREQEGSRVLPAAGASQGRGWATLEDAEAARRRLAALREAVQRMQAALSHHSAQQRELEGQIEQLHEQRRRLQMEYGSLRAHGDRIAAQLRVLSERTGGTALLPPREPPVAANSGGSSGGGSAGPTGGSGGARSGSGDGGGEGGGGGVSAAGPSRAGVLTPLRMMWRGGDLPLGSVGGAAPGGSGGGLAAALRCPVTSQRPPTPDRRGAGGGGGGSGGPRAAHMSPRPPGLQQQHQHHPSADGSPLQASSPQTGPPHAPWRTPAGSCDGSGAASPLGPSPGAPAAGAAAAGALLSRSNGSSPLRMPRRALSPQYYASSRHSMDGASFGSGGGGWDAAASPQAPGSPLAAGGAPLTLPPSALPAVWPPVLPRPPLGAAAAAGAAAVEPLLQSGGTEEGAEETERLPAAAAGGGPQEALQQEGHQEHAAQLNQQPAVQQQEQQQQQQQQQQEQQEQPQPARRFEGLEALRRHNEILGRETQILEAEARLSRAEARLLRAQEAVLQRQAQLLRHQVAQMAATRQQQQQQQQQQRRGEGQQQQE